MIQTMGRAARHVEGKVIMYADNVTGSMERALKEVDRRRLYQIKMNKKHGIKPRSIEKPIRERLVEKDEENALEFIGKKGEMAYKTLPDIDLSGLTPLDRRKLVAKLRREMRLTAQDLNFELAAEIRDKISELKT